MKLRGGNTTRKIGKNNSKGKNNVDELFNRLVNENINRPLVRANSTRRKKANTVKQSNTDTREATEGVMLSYAIRDNRANLVKNSDSRLRSRSRSRSRAKTIGRSRSRSRSRSRGKTIDKRNNPYDPYDRYSEFEKLMNSLANKNLKPNKKGITKVKQSRGKDHPGTFGRPNR